MEKWPLQQYYKEVKEEEKKVADFPDFKKSIEDYLYEEEGNITRNKLLMVGSLALIMSCLFALDVSAGHSSHRSHSSHSSHRSGSSGHYSHSSHESHQSGTSHSSHSSAAHSNYSEHSNAAPVVTPAPTPIPTPTPEPMPYVQTPKQMVSAGEVPAVSLPIIPPVPETIVPAVEHVALVDAAVTTEANK